MGLWGVAPPPLWVANPRNLGHFHHRTVPRVRAKFREDPSVNKGSYLSGGRHFRSRSKPTEVRIVTFVSGFRPASGLRPGQGSATASRDPTRRSDRSRRGYGRGGDEQRTNGVRAHATNNHNAHHAVATTRTHAPRTKQRRRSTRRTFLGGCAPKPPHSRASRSVSNT